MLAVINAGRKSHGETLWWLDASIRRPQKIYYGKWRPPADAANV